MAFPILEHPDFWETPCDNDDYIFHAFTTFAAHMAKYKSLADRLEAKGFPVYEASWSMSFPELSAAAAQLPEWYGGAVPETWEGAFDNGPLSPAFFNAMVQNTSTYDARFPKWQPLVPPDSPYSLAVRMQGHFRNVWFNLRIALGLNRMLSKGEHGGRPRKVHPVI